MTQELVFSDTNLKDSLMLDTLSIKRCLPYSLAKAVEFLFDSEDEPVEGAWSRRCYWYLRDALTYDFPTITEETKEYLIKTVTPVAGGLSVGNFILLIAIFSLAHDPSEREFLTELLVGENFLPAIIGDVA